MEPAGDQARELTATGRAGPARSFPDGGKPHVLLLIRRSAGSRRFSGLLVLPRRTPVPDASHQRRPFASRICGGDRRFARGAGSSPSGARARRVRSDAADRLHEFPPVRREIQRFARRTCAHRRRRADQGGCDRQPGGSGRGAHDRLRRPGRDAGTDRRALALHFRRAADPNSVRGGRRLYLPGRERRGGAHADARLHHGSGPRRPFICAQTGDRRRTRAGTAHLSVRRHDHDDRRTRGSASPVRSAAEPGRSSELHGADRRRQYRRQRRRSAPAGARAASAGRVPDQTGGRRRRVVAAHHAGHADVQRARASRRRGGGRRSQYLRRRARVSARRDPAGDRRGRSVHRARASDGRGDRQTDGGQGRLAEHSTVRQATKTPFRSAVKAGSIWTRSLPERTPPTRWRKPTSSRPPSARICCFPRRRRRVRGSC